MNNKLSNRLGEEIAQGEQLCQDVNLLMAWTKEQEDGTMVMLSERLQKLEDRMAEKDQESEPSRKGSLIILSRLSVTNDQR